jgi:L-lactate utilization protein LutB
VKERSVGNRDLLEEALTNLRANGIRVLMAKSREAALVAVQEELKGAKLVVKSKSNITKELHMSEHLTSLGIEVIETDLGDRIIQLLGCRAAHPTGPACHLTRDEISRLFSDHFGRKVSSDPAELTSTMRDEIASYLSRAKIGITGANAIAASDGAVVIVHNEGNAAKCAMLQDKHIIVSTPDKIVPTLEDALNIVRLQTYLSTGKVLTSFINIITGPSYTADIEKELYKGMHGPSEVVLILVDDGRLSADDMEPQYCIGCGMCLLRCPIYTALGPVFGTAGHMGGQGVYLSGSIGNMGESLESGMFLCTACGACTEVCPSRIDTKRGIGSLRSQVRESGTGAPEEHDDLLSSIRNYDNPWQVPRNKKARWAKGLGMKAEGKVLYFAGCSTSLLSPDRAMKVVQILRALGFEPAHLGPAERCCGSIARKVGDAELAKSKAEACLKDFVAAGARTVVTSCPGCASALNHYEDLVQRYGVEVLHLTQFLDRHLGKMELGSVSVDGPVTYHDPCDLGRALGVYDEPRRVLGQMLGESVLEMERRRNESACCGSGGGVRSAYPELADSVSRDRLRMAKEIGAKAIITSCPWCVQSLSECQGDEKKMPVIDLLDLVHEALTKG